MRTVKKAIQEAMDIKTKSHPCYSGGCQNARMHLPVAPACNISCNYCSRKFDCVNESRPGVTSVVLTPEKALEKFMKVRERLGNLKVVGIAGPGDALANFDATRKTFALIRKQAPDMTFCLSTNGLCLPEYAEELAKLGVTHVTVTINAVDPAIGARIYRDVYYQGIRYTGQEAAKILLKNQLEGLEKLRDLGIVVKVNTVMMKGINDLHVEEVARKVREYGVYIGNLMQMIPAPGSVFENMPLITNKELNERRKSCSKYLKQMFHCRQCRADAIGPLGQDCSAEFREQVEESSAKEAVKAAFEKILIAVASSNEKVVDKHFGHASRLLIYQYENGRVDFLESRAIKSFCSGAEGCGDSEDSIHEILQAVKDCHIVLTQRIGYFPQKVLESHGKMVIQAYGYIDEEICKAVASYAQAFLKAKDCPADSKISMGYTLDSRRKVAVASSDGIWVNQHFGSAKEFWIYEVFENGEYNFIEQRGISLKEKDVSHHAKITRLVDILQDVEAVLSVQIGSHAERLLLYKGINAFTVSSDIDKALRAYGKRSKIVRSLSMSCAERI